MSLFLFVRNVSAQILDDSTKNIYGPTTTRYILEEDLYNIKGKPHSLDTSLTNAHLYDYLYGSNPHQNLGLIGTPLNPIYYTPPQTIGRNLGINIFDAYAYDPSGINYYNTKSPFSKLRYVQGSRGQQILEADFARNVNPRWNLGVDFRRVASVKQVGSTVARDPQASGYAAAVYTRYSTKNQRYQLLFNYTHLHQTNNEFGGILNSDSVRIQDLTNYRVLDGQLNSGVTRERRNNFHLYHQYGILKDSVLQIFHIADYQYRDNRYQDLAMAGDSFYFNLKVIPRNSSSMTDRTDFNLFENKIGLKGQIKRFNYKAYFRAKQFTYEQITTDTIKSKYDYKEDFLGGELAYVFKDTSVLSFSGQKYVRGRDYYLKAYYTSKFLSGGFYRINYSPTLVQSNYIGNFFSWNNPNFDNTTTDNLWLDLNLRVGKLLRINPGVRYTGIKNYIYFNESFVPAQENSNIKLYMASMNFFLRLGTFNITERFIYTKYDGAPVLNVPEVYSHTRAYFQTRAFHKAAVLQFGLDAFWRSTYYANGYMPIIEQYYLNNSVPVKNYMLVDLFLDVRVKRANVFVKISNLLQGVGSSTSPFRKTYYTTPGYPGLPRSFDFGIMWMFFD
ncbi:putative porin [Sporocytophaga myxococcoides]|uniref:putative porin n=1 Tax=Sporocytophaga myxococcoides TaxID=153721 RepID=UPI0018CE0505|nr:putative porin [Sporocytophaga myxococcoides]